MKSFMFDDSSRPNSCAQIVRHYRLFRGLFNYHRSLGCAAYSRNNQAICRNRVFYVSVVYESAYTKYVCILYECMVCMRESVADTEAGPDPCSSPV